MFGGVTGKRRVIRLNVKLEVILKFIRVQEGHGGLRIVVVLVLAGLARFGFNQELRRVALPDLVLDSKV